jgi:hypothetical protein
MLFALGLILGAGLYALVQWALKPVPKPPDPFKGRLIEIDGRRGLWRVERTYVIPGGIAFLIRRVSRNTEYFDDGAFCEHDPDPDDEGDDE